MESDRDRQRLSYRLCWAGFSILAVSTIAGAFDAIGNLLLFFSGRFQGLGAVLDLPSYDFAIDTLRNWPRMIGAILLWAAWPESDWKRRAGLLALMSMFDVGLWTSRFAVPLGLAADPLGHQFLSMIVGITLRWSELILMGGLAASVARQVGMVDLDDFARAQRTICYTGASIFFFFLIQQIDWARDWPLAPLPLNPTGFMALLAYRLILCISLTQASLLTLTAARSAAHGLKLMAVEDRSFDPWTDGQDAAGQLALTGTRSA